MRKIVIPAEIERQYNDEIIKANGHITLTNQPGKTSPRWFASMKNLHEAGKIAKSVGADTTPIVNKLIHAVESLARNIHG